MALYFFDFHDSGSSVLDKDGTDLPDVETARDEATTALIATANDILPGDGHPRELTIIVRDGRGQDILQVAIWFCVRVL